METNLYRSPLATVFFPGILYLSKILMAGKQTWNPRGSKNRICISFHHPHPPPFKSMTIDKLVAHKFHQQCFIFHTGRCWQRGCRTAEGRAGPAHLLVSCRLQSHLQWAQVLCPGLERESCTRRNVRNTESLCISIKMIRQAVEMGMRKRLFISRILNSLTKKALGKWEESRSIGFMGRLLMWVNCLCGMRRALPHWAYLSSQASGIFHTNALVSIACLTCSKLSTLSGNHFILLTKLRVRNSKHPGLSAHLGPLVFVTRGWLGLLSSAGSMGWMSEMAVFRVGFNAGCELVTRPWLLIEGLHVASSEGWFQDSCICCMAANFPHS